MLLRSRTRRFFSHCIKCLPFEIDRKKANDIISGFGSIFEKDTNVFKSSEIVHFKSDPVSKKYVPFHSADIKKLSTSYIAEY